MIRNRHALVIQERNQRRVPRTPGSSRNATTRAVASSRPVRPVALLTLEQAWRLKHCDLLRDHPEFFSSHEATLEVQTAVGQRRAAYKDVPVSDVNNSDLKEIYRLEYEPKISGGGSAGSFKHLCIVAGQLLRLCIICDVLQMETLWKPGQLFQAICHKETVDLLLSHFCVRAVCTTVMTNAFQLKKSASMPRFISKAKVNCTLPMQNAVAYICVLCLTSKKLSRDSAPPIVGLSMTVYPGRQFLCRRTFRVANKKIGNTLDAILASFDSTTVDHGVRDAVNAVFKQGRIKNRWSMNFINLLVLTGGGQRPQVYTQLQLPSSGDLSDMKEMAGNQGFIQMRTVKEKLPVHCACPSCFSLDMCSSTWNSIAPSCALPLWRQLRLMSRISSTSRC